MNFYIISNREIYQYPSEIIENKIFVGDQIHVMLIK